MLFFLLQTAALQVEKLMPNVAVQAPHWTKALSDFVSAIGIIAGGIWVYYKFGLFRERYPAMEIENNVQYIGEDKQEYFLELSCTVENKGKARKWVAPLDYDLLCLKNIDGFHKKSDKEINNEVFLDNFFEVYNRQSELNHYGKKYWVAPDWYIPFVDGSTKKKFIYLIAIPKEVAYLSLYTRFIDFNSKKKAIRYLKEMEVRKENKSWKDGRYKKWNEMRLAEKLDEIQNKKTDFYNTQITLAINTIKKNVPLLESE
jgi:hypothetical protein